MSPRFRGYFAVCRALMLGGVVAVARGTEPGPPAVVVARLAAEDFKSRQEAQDSLLQWGRKNPAEAKEWLFQRSQGDPDPEIRHRCNSVLFELVVEDFKKEGEGYLGIMMLAVPVQVPGDPGQRIGIRVTFVVPGSPVAKAGMPIGDVIVGAGDQVWREADADMQFQKWIRDHKPGQKVTLKVLRAGQVADVAVTLDRRPADVDRMLPFNEAPQDLEKLERVEKDAYFRSWLEKRKKRS